MSVELECGIFGGPIVPPISPTGPTGSTGCTAGSFEFYNQVNDAVGCMITEGGGPLVPGSIAFVTNLPTVQPFSCMIDLLTGPYSVCGSSIPDDRRMSAFNAFTEITGFKALNLEQIFNTLSEEQRNLIELNAFYLFVPVTMLFLGMIWLMVGFELIDWPAGIFLTILMFIVVYLFSVGYQIQAQNYVDSVSNTLRSEAAAAQTNLENSVAYWPQGLFGVACAVTATGTTGWKCNETGIVQENAAEQPRVEDVTPIEERSKTLPRRSKIRRRNGR